MIQKPQTVTDCSTWIPGSSSHNFERNQTVGYLPVITMFPQIGLFSDNRRGYLPEPQPPPLPKPTKPTISALPALNGQRLSSYSALDSIGSLLPQIRNDTKESKSQSVRELIDRISINNKLLYFELSAIRIQSTARKFLANLRIQRIRQRLALFLRVTQSCADRYIEEFVLASAFEISLEFYRQHRKFQMMKDSVDRELLICTEEITNELISELTVEVTNETISEAIEVVIAQR